MKYLPYIVTALLIVLLTMKDDWDREGSTVHSHFDAASGQDNNGDNRLSVIFSARQPNDQYCFYDGQIDKDHIEYPHTLAAGKLLTPRSLHRNDVRESMLMEDEAVNVASHMLVNPITTPVSLTCMASTAVFLVGNVVVAAISGPGVALSMLTLGKVAAVSCGLKLAAYAGVLGTIVYHAFDEDSFDVDSLISNDLQATSTEYLVRLRKAFTWLESRDAMQCPTKPQASMQTKVTSKQQEHGA